MDLLAGDDDLDEAGGAVLVADPVGHVALRVRRDVHAEHHGGSGVGEGALVDHLAGTALLRDGRALLGGLEDEQHGARDPFAYARQHGGGSHEHGGVAVVTARVGDGERPAGVLLVHGRGGEVGTAEVLDRKGVDVGAQRDDAVTGPAAAQDADDTVPGDAGADLVEVQGAEVVGDVPGGVRLPVGQLRMLVEVVAPGHHPVGHVGRPPVQLTVDRLVAHGPHSTSAIHRLCRFSP